MPAGPSAWRNASASSAAFARSRKAVPKDIWPSGSGSAFPCFGRKPRMPDLLLEVGCEEIPAGPLAAALLELERRFGEALTGAQLQSARISALGTPRRLALVVRGLGARQPDLDERIEGPPVTAGEKAKAGFAR